MSENVFFQDLAVMMTAAGIAAAVFARLGWPKVLGYLLAGLIMNEYTWGGAFLIDGASTQVAGQLGVIFLMFGMGLSFSPREMKKIRSVAIPAALIDTIVMIWLGYTLGTRVFGWGKVPSFFLGVGICDSATTLLAKVIGEMGWSKRPFAKYVFGTSVCEDIICVGAIAVATGFAAGGDMSVGSFFTSLGGLGVFFLSVLVFGFILVPRFLHSVAKLKDDEALLLALLGCCFLITFLALKMGCSLALGAFLVGIIGGSSDVHARLERLVEPLKAMYSAVFFISIGLLIDPTALCDHWAQILLVSAVVVIGKTLNVCLSSLFAGVELKTAIQSGLSLAQIGEFAFMVAILYSGLVGKTDNAFFTVAIGASLVTTLLNPVLIRVSDPLGDFAERHLPERLKVLHEGYRAWIEKIRSSEDSAGFKRVRHAAFRLAIYGVLMTSVSVVCTILSHFDYSRFSIFFERHDELIFFLVANVFVLSLMPLVLAAARELGLGIARILIGRATARWVRPIYQIIRIFVLAAVLVLYFGVWSMLDIAVAPVGINMLWILILFFALTAILGWGFFVRAGRRATARFHEALSAEERREGLAKTMTVTVPEGTIHKFVLDESSPAIGGTVVTLNIRAKTGASIVSVVRDGVVTRNIGPEWEFRVGDTLVALGDHQQVVALKDLLGVTA